MLRLIFCAVAFWSPLAAQDAGLRERSAFDSRNRFLEDGFPEAQLRQSVTIIDSFEDAEQSRKVWASNRVELEFSPEHATDGKAALQVRFPGETASLTYRRGSIYWGSAEAETTVAWSSRLLFNDEVRLDVFNPQSEPVHLKVVLGKPFRFKLQPGSNEIRLKTEEIAKAVYRPSGVLGSFTLSIEGSKPAHLSVDHFRWIGPGLGENLVRHAKAFDFGSAQYVRPYFHGVSSTTAYSSERGYGWERPYAKEFDYTRNMNTSGSSGRQPHDELLRDAVFNIQSPFFADLAAGRYRMHVVEGFVGWTQGMPGISDLSVTVDDGPRAILRRGVKTPSEFARVFYGRDRVDYEPGEDKWARYMAPMNVPLEHEFETAGGRVKFEFATDPPRHARLSFLILYPADKAGAIEPELAALWKDLRYRFNEMSYGFIPREMAQSMRVPGFHEEYLAPEVQERKRAALRLTPEDRSRGYVLFARDPQDDVFPDSVPAPEEVGRPTTAFGAPGEIETLTLNLHALRNLEHVGVTLEDFSGPGGATIRKDRIELRSVRCEYRMSGQQTHGDWKYTILPWYLVRRDAVRIPARVSHRFWLNVSIPAGSPAGVYAGKAILKGRDVPAQEVPLSLDVLPVALDAVPDSVEHSVCMSNQVWVPPAFDHGRSLWTFADLKDPERSRQYGERARLFRQGLEAEAALIRRYGISAVYGPETILSAPSPISLQDLADRHHLAFFKVGRDRQKEPPVGKDAVKRVFLFKLADFTEAAVRRHASSGARVLLNDINWWSDLQQESGIYRFESGFLLWRLGAQGCVYNPWHSTWGDPYNAFDGHSGEWGSLCMPASEEWPALNSSVLLEGIREGIKDYRYLATLTRLASEGAAPEAGLAARKWLEELKGRIRGEASHYFQPVGPAGGWDETWSQKETAWKGADYRKVRRELAEHIARLQRRP